MSPATILRVPLVVLAVVLAVSACSPGGTVDLDDVFAHQEEWSLVADPQEAAGELCTDGFDCIQAYTTSGADFLRFDSAGEAEDAAATTEGPTHRSGTALIRFDSSLTPEMREAVVEWFEYSFEDDVDLDTVFAEKVMGWYLQSNPQEATGELCTDGFDCIQAYTTDQADYLRFETTGEAEEAAARIDAETHLSDYIVVRFTDPELTDEQRTQITESIDGVHNSDA